MKRRLFVQTSLLSLLTAPAQAQFGQPKLPKIPGVKAPEFSGEQFVKHTPPLTTNLADVFEAVPGFDNYHPTDAASLTLVPRNADGDYLTLPGLFEIVAQSFCLKAGTNPPSKNVAGYGSGYLYAPLKGPKAGQIDRILRRSEDHPELPQHEVQLLLWAIIAESKLSECPKNIQKTARILLEEKDRRALENDTLAVVPAPLRGKVYGSLPPLVREALEAENKMREVLAQKLSEASESGDALVESANAPGEKVSALYAQMEAIAMRVGPLPEVPEKERVPWGQWSWHPEGFFIRILPDGYSTTKRQLYFPEQFTITGERLTAPDGRVLTVRGRTVTLGTTTLSLARDVALNGDSKALQALRAAAYAAEGTVEERPISNLLARAALSAIARGKRVARATTQSERLCAPFGGGFGGGGGGGAGMSAPGTQRLGQSRTPRDNPNIDRARKATNALSNFGGHVTKGLDLPFFMTDAQMNWQFNMANAIDRAMNGESTNRVPGPGGNEPEALCGKVDDAITPLPRPKHVRQGMEPPTVVAARQALGDALATLGDVGRQRQEAEKRFLGARTADNGLALVAHRRRWGVAQVAVADAGEALIAAYEKAEGPNTGWEEGEWRAYCQRLRTMGFTANERATAQAVGMSDAEIDAYLAQQRALLSETVPSGGAIDALKNLCDALRAAGTDYTYLPPLSLASEKNLEL